MCRVLACGYWRRIVVTPLDRWETRTRTVINANTKKLLFFIFSVCFNWKIFPTAAGAKKPIQL
jgi:hypothetical protein